MAKPQPRETYDREAREILRIVSIVEADNKRTQDWKNATLKALRNASRLLLAPPD